MIASLIHSACILFLLFLIPMHMNLKKTILITTVGVFALYIIVNQQFIYSIVALFSIEKAIMVASISTDKVRLILNSLRVMLVFIEFVLFWWFVNRKAKMSDVNIPDNFKGLLLKCNIVILIVLPLFKVMPDSYRVQTILIFLNYIYFSYYFKPIKVGKISKKQAIFNIALVSLSLLNLYMLVLRSENINTVFWPVFNYNVLFK